MQKVGIAIKFVLNLLQNLKNTCHINVVFCSPNELIIYAAVCRTAPATPGLSNTEYAPCTTIFALNKTV